MGGTKKTMSEVEKKEWDELYQYVRKEILLYDEAQSIPSSLVLRLKGLTTGKFIDNRRTEDKANYSYKIVLYTFQICKPSIMAGIANKEFNSELNKFNYICKIVENNINDVYLRIKKVKRTDEKVQSMKIDNLLHSGADYSRKTEDVDNEKLNSLW